MTRGHREAAETRPLTMVRGVPAEPPHAVRRSPRTPCGQSEGCPTRLLPPPPPPLSAAAQG